MAGSMLCGSSTTPPDSGDSECCKEIAFALGEAGATGGALTLLVERLGLILDGLTPPDLDGLIEQVDDFDETSYAGDASIIWDSTNNTLYLLIAGAYVEIPIPTGVSGGGGDGNPGDDILTQGDVANALSNLVALYPGTDPNLAPTDAGYVDPGDSVVLFTNDSIWYKDPSGTWIQWTPNVTGAVDCSAVVQCALDDLAQGMGASGVYGVAVSGPSYMVGDIHTNLGVYTLDTITAATIPDLVAQLNAAFAADGYPLTAIDNAGVLNITTSNGSIPEFITDEGMSPAALVPFTVVSAPVAASKLCPPIVSCIMGYLGTNAGMAQWVTAYNAYAGSGNAPVLTGAAPYDAGAHVDAAALESAYTGPAPSLVCWADGNSCPQFSIVKVGGDWDHLSQRGELQTASVTIYTANDFNGSATFNIDPRSFVAAPDCVTQWQINVSSYAGNTLDYSTILPQNPRASISVSGTAGISKCSSINQTRGSNSDSDGNTSIVKQNADGTLTIIRSGYFQGGTKNSVRASITGYLL